MKLAALVAVLALAAASGARAEVSPQPGPGDPHIQTILYDAQQVVDLKVAMGYALTVEFSPDEKIETVTVGNSAAWQVSADKEASRLFVKPMQGSLDTNMTVITDTRVYAFELKAWPSPDPAMPFLVRFQYPVAPQASVEPPPPEKLAKPGKPEKPFTLVVTYAFSGSARLKPSGMNDDGHSTFITWPEKTPIPAVSVVEDDGKVVLTNGAVRAGRLVIDEVADRFIFRFDGETAEVIRHVKKVRKK
jgi:type IV secretion system protein VirB9